VDRKIGIIVIVLSLAVSLIAYHTYCKKIDSVFSKENLEKEYLSSPLAYINPIGFLVYLFKYYTWAEIFPKYFFPCLLLVFNLILAEVVLKKKYGWRSLTTILLCLTGIITVYFNEHKPITALMATVSLFAIASIVYKKEIEKEDLILCSLSTILLILSVIGLLL